MAQTLSAILARYAAAGAVVYGGEEPAGEAAARAVRYWRQRGKGMAEAIKLALADEAAEPKRRRWPSNGAASYQNQASKSGGRWIEDTAGAGLRFVGFADDIAKRNGSGYPDNSGWYMREDGDGGEVYRGAVYQLPADKLGRPRYVPAVREGSESRRDGWQDMATGKDSGAAMVWLGDIELGEPGGDEFERGAGYDKAALDAARFADGRAERLAEESRDYDTAWNRGSNAASALEDSRQARAEFLRLRAEIKAQAPLFDGQPDSAICEALDSACKAAVRAWQRGKARAAELAREWQDSDGFAEGFGQ